MNVQAQGFCEELLKIAAEKTRDVGDGTPFPGDRPGPIYTRRLFGDAVAGAVATALGGATGHFAMQALKNKPGGIKMNPGLRSALRYGIGPVVTGSAAVALSQLANEMRKRRLVSAIAEDRERARAKAQKID